MKRPECIDKMARLIAENDGLDLPPEQATRVWDHVVAPLLWLHAEAAHKLEIERLAHTRQAVQTELHRVHTRAPGRQAERQFPRGWGDRG